MSVRYDRSIADGKTGPTRVRSTRRIAAREQSILRIRPLSTGPMPVITMSSRTGPTTIVAPSSITTTGKENESNDIK